MLRRNLGTDEVIALPYPVGESHRGIAHLEALGIAYLDFTSVFKESPTPESGCDFGAADGHPNPRGQEKVTEELEKIDEGLSLKASLHKN